MQLFDKPNKYTLFYYLFSSNFAHTTTFEPVLLFRLPSLLPKVKTDSENSMQLFDKPNKYTLFYYLFSSNFAHTTTFEPVLLFRLPSLLPKVKTDGSQAERKQKVRFDSVSLHKPGRTKAKGEVRFRFTPYSLHHLLSDGPTVVPSLVSIFPLFLILTILQSNRSNKMKGIKEFWK